MPALENTRQSLETRLRQQEAVARLGEEALWGPSLQELFDQAASYLSELLQADLTKVLEWHPENGELLLKSGVGFSGVGSATEPDRWGSAAGYALLTEEPVVVRDLAAEDRFTPSDLLREHGAASGMAVVIRGAQRPYGVLAAFSTTHRKFDRDDVNFLRSLANVLAASLQRTESEQELRRSEAWFREMADGLPIMVWMHGASGEQELVNRRLCDYFGVSREKMTGERWESVLHPEDAPGYKAEFLRCLEEQRPFRAEVRVKRADGEWRLVESRGELRYSESGGFQGIVGASLDITEQRAAEQQLKEADRRKNEFLALLGHELRNPLTPIASAATQLERERDSLDREKLGEVASVLSRQSTYLSRVVSDLLDVSRLDRGMLKLDKKTIDLRDLVWQAGDSIPELAQEGQRRWALELPDEPLPITGDPVRLAQVFTNLLDNAVKHTRPPGAIRVVATLTGGNITVQVRDEGAGIDPASLPRLFEPFERGAHSESAGLGLGLPLVKQVVELHGGRVDAHSAGAGKGSIFTVRLPAESVRSPERGNADENAHGETETESAASADRIASLLLVEDHDDVAQALQSLLEGFVQCVHRVASGSEAIEAVRNDHYDLALVDVRLPDMTGFEVASHLRELRSRISVIGLSGYPASNFSDEAIAVFDDYLLKPPSEEALEQALTRAHAAD